jgi:hypothetical protein
MMRRLGGCVGRLLVGLLLVLGVAFAWYNRHELGDLWDRVTGGGVTVSPELAAQADEKLASLGQGEGGGDRRVALDASELQSLIEYRWAGFLPPDVVNPKVEITDGRVTLEGGVATARFGRVSELEDIIAFLPDTAALRAVGSFVPLDSEHVALEIHELGAASIPVPSRLIPTVLSRFRGSSAPGLAPNGIAVPLPPGISNVYVSGDSLVFVASPGGD